MADTSNNKQVLYKFGTREEYDRIKDNALDNALYFLTDTGELLRGKVNLAQAHYYETVRGLNESDAEAIARATQDAVALVCNDVCVIRTQIANDKYSHTAFVYDEIDGALAWRAMDGNYDANSVYFNKDLIFTTDVGYAEVDASGSAVVPAQGKNVTEVLQYLFARETEPTVVQPSMTISAPVNKVWEVGSVVTPSYTLTFQPGSYSFGPETGVEATFQVTDSNSAPMKDGATGTMDAFTVQDDTNYTITAVAVYGDGSIPVSNLGTQYPNKKIVAGNLTKTSPALTGYRPFYWGATTAEEVNNLTIHGLEKSTNAASARTLGVYKASEVPGATKVIVAIPANANVGVKKVIMPSAWNTDITSEFVLQDTLVPVNGANNYQAIDYKVWVYQPAILDQSETYTITLG